MPTRKLYWEDAYLKEFSSKVVSVSKGDRLSLILESTAFYPESGGQACDKGIIKGEGFYASVEYVREEGGEIIHEATKWEGSVEVGSVVKGMIDWDRRYRLMKMHTAAHLLSAIIRKVKGGGVKVVSAHKDYDTSRIDFNVKIAREELPTIEEEANKAISKGAEVKAFFLKRDEATKYVARYGEDVGLVPPEVEEVRVVEIVGLHAVACGGTHVRDLREIGGIRILKRQSKGKGITRLIYTLTEGGRP